MWSLEQFVHCFEVAEVLLNLPNAEQKGWRTCSIFLEICYKVLSGVEQHEKDESDAGGWWSGAGHQECREEGGRQLKTGFLPSPGCRLGSWARQTSRQTNKVTTVTPNNNSQSQALAVLPLRSILYIQYTVVLVIQTDCWFYNQWFLLHIDFFCPLWLRSMGHGLLMAQYIAWQDKVLKCSRRFWPFLSLSGRSQWVPHTLVCLCESGNYSIC